MFQIVSYSKDLQDEKAIFWHNIPSSRLGLVWFKLCHIYKIYKMKRQFSGIIFQVPNWVWYVSNCAIFKRFTRWKGNFLTLYSKFQIGFDNSSESRDWASDWSTSVFQLAMNDERIKANRMISLEKLNSPNLEFYGISKVRHICTHKEVWEGDSFKG